MRNTPPRLSAAPRHRVLAASLAGLLAAGSALAAENPSISVTKTITPNPVVAGQPVTWQIRVLNAGEAPAHNVVIQELMPHGIRQVTAYGDAYDCVRDSRQVRCTAVELAPGTSTITIEGIAAQSGGGSASQVAPVAALGPQDSITTLHDQSVLALQGALDSAVKANVKLVVQNDAATASLADTQATLATAQSDLASLQSRLDAALKEDAEADARLAALESKLGTALAEGQAKGAEADKRMTDLQAQLDSALVSTSAQAAQVAELTAKNAALTTQLAEAQAKIASSVETAAQAEQLAATIEELRRQKEATEAAIARVAELSTALEIAQQTVDHATPLDFAKDCPEGAGSQEWLIDHLPGLLKVAIDNPTSANTRSFLCAQSAVMGSAGVAALAARGEPSEPPAVESAVRWKLYTEWRGKDASFLELRNAARRGDVHALNDLGVLMVVGEGVAKDVAGGERLLSSAARLGSPLAATNLATMYERGVGVMADASRANQWQRIASVLTDKQNETAAAN